jgi:hypothetical protein
VRRQHAGLRLLMLLMLLVRACVEHALCS